MEATKICKKCKKKKELTEFPLLRSAKDGRYSYCKDCSKEIAKIRHAANSKERNDFYNNFL